MRESTIKICEKIYNKGYRPYLNDSNTWEIWHCGPDNWDATLLSERGAMRVCGDSLEVFKAFTELYGRNETEYRTMRGIKPMYIWTGNDKGDYIYYGKNWKN